MNNDQAREQGLGSEHGESSDPGSDQSMKGEESASSEMAGSEMEQPSAEESRTESELPESIEQAVAEEEAGELPAEAEAALPTGEPEVKPESRLGRFFKRALRWVVFLVVVFAIGVLAMEFVRVQPQREEISNLNQALEAAETAQAELQAELSRLEGVEAENEELSRALAIASTRQVIQEIRLDVAQAQLALAQGDAEGVAEALHGTGENLNELRDLLGALKAAEVEALRERLVLVLSEVDSDPFAAERDLEILANTLQEIERDVSRP